MEISYKLSCKTEPFNFLFICTFSCMLKSHEISSLKCRCKPIFWFHFNLNILPFLSGFVQRLTRRIESLANWRRGSTVWTIWSMIILCWTELFKASRMKRQCCVEVPLKNEFLTTTPATSLWSCYCNISKIKPKWSKKRQMWQ